MHTVAPSPRRHRLLRRPAIRIAMITTGAALLTTVGVAAPAHASDPGLPRLNITATYVAGISSGGFMATQLQVAYSATFRGAAIVAAGPYDCGNGNLLVLATQCGTDLTGLDVTTLEHTADTWAAEGKIDPLSNLQGKPVYTYHGQLDPLVSTPVSDAGVAFYRHYGADTLYHAGDPAGHGWPTPLGLLPCPTTAYPFLINCGDDPEGEMLTHWFGAINPPNNGAPLGTLRWYDQDRYVPGGWGAWYSMASSNLLYSPPTCAAGAPCRLVVVLHGCASDTTFTGDEFPEYSYVDNYADTNNLVVLYPQTSISTLRANPEGCWDWWGYDGGDYAIKTGPQMRAITNMVHALGG
jgi:poly(3-hydroxybutyrate) depolymerase